ncbi:hypothetical protein C8R45DRAFT_963989 [Mycena sanguinolenta]|nr:hypothetical protein C8R45DRAFT_963989 [Mycena sanguinolenta]
MNAELEITDPLTTSHIELLEHSYGRQEPELLRARLELMGLSCTYVYHPQPDFALPVIWPSTIVNSLDPTAAVIAPPRGTSPRAGTLQYWPPSFWLIFQTTAPPVSPPGVVLGPEVGATPPHRSALISRSNARAKPSSLSRLRQRRRGIRQPDVTSELERPGHCAICREEEAIMAPIDCGHLAMCRQCSDGVMNTSRLCPICRQRIEEGRLIRIFKT